MTLVAHCYVGVNLSQRIRISEKRMIAMFGSDRGSETGEWWPFIPN
jgi:hypothetical protein